MDRKEFKSKPQHLVTDAKTGEILRIVHPSNTEIGTQQFNANLRVFGDLEITNFHSVANAPVFGHRLSLSGSTSLAPSNIPSGSILYLTSHTSDMLGLFDGTGWKMMSASVVSTTLSDLSLTANKNYDVFVHESPPGSLALELQVWSTDVIRAVALVKQNGVLVKSGEPTKRYTGTVRTQATTSIPDSTSKRFVWNYYNRAPRFLNLIETTDSWNYAVATFRQTRGSPTNRFEYVAGLADVELEAVAHSIYYSTTSTVTCMGGVGIDSTTVNSAQTWGGNNGAANIAQYDTARYQGYPGIGYHAVNWLEYGGTNVIFLGDFNVPQYQSGMHGKIWG
jgi:hypothetical protein